MAVQKKFASSTHRTALGKGLDALISTEPVRADGSTTISEIAITSIEANPNQPRRDFDAVSLGELAESIRAIGIIQPITLHELSDNRYMIIAGERRWRAAQMAGLTTIPAYIRPLSQASIMELALIENVQREDLNIIEVALAYQQLMEQDGMTQEKLSQRVGKNRTVVTNTLRLLRLPAEVQMALQKGVIDMGHARALLAIDSPTEQVNVFRETVAKGYSVRQVEEIAAKISSKAKTKVRKNTMNHPTPLMEKYATAATSLHTLLGTKVRVSRTKNGRGTITIAFDSDNTFDTILAKLHTITS